MAQSYVQVAPDSTGKKVQTVQNTVNGQLVEANAIVLHDTTGFPKDDYQTLFYDAWSSSPIDTTDKWTVTGTAPTIANGNMTMAATLSSYHAIQTKDTIRANVGYTLVRNGIALETAAAVGAGRFWGLGTPAATPAAAVLAQNGIGFEIDQASGALLAVTYANGVRTTVATLTRPTDGLNHGYGIFFRVTQAFWMMDGSVVASQSFPNVLVAELPALIVRQNAASFTGTPVFTNIAHLTADTSRQGGVIADPIVGTRQVRVSADGSLKTAEAPSSLCVTGTAASGTGVTVTLPAVAGQFHYITAIQIELVATAARTGSASLISVTGTNMPGPPVWNFDTAQAIGAVIARYMNFPNPIKSSVSGTATTIVAPVATTGVWRINVFYYTAG